MSDESVFYMLGGALAALALIVSFAGLRARGFPPSRAAMVGVVALFAVLVLGAGAYAWMAAEEEQEHRDELIAAGEHPSPAEVMEEIAAAGAEQEEEAGGGEAGGEQASSAGAELFDSVGCASCHTLQAANATGTVGPDLDTELSGEDVAFIEESIVDPGAELAEGFSGGIMPDDYEQELSPQELEAIVEFLAEATGAQR